MNNKDSQSQPNAENELTAKEDRYTYDKEESQQPLSEQMDEAEEELRQQAGNDRPDIEDEELPVKVEDRVEQQSGFGQGGSGGGGTSSRGGGSKVWIAISAILALLLVIVLIKPPFGGSDNTAVATVNGSDISKDRLYDALVKAGGTQTLDQLITEELIAQEAKAQNVTVTDADIDAEIADIKKNFNSDAEFDNALTQAGYTLESLKEDSRTNILVRKILEPKANITDEAIKEYYEANEASFATPEQIQASHILVATQEEADAILAELKQGGDFAAIAQEKSTDPGSKDAGGDLGFFGKGQMVAEFEEAAFALAINEISDVVKTEHGFHIIKKTAEKAAYTPTLESEKDNIKKQLLATKIQELSGTWITEIHDKAKITNSLEPSPSPSPSADAAK
jgi:foldase protein PrsA